MKKHDGCKGCRYTNKNFWEHPCRSCKGTEVVIRKDYWKPCDNMLVDSNARLPEIGSEVLCLTVYGYYTVGALFDGAWRLDKSERYEPVSAVTHWMPLPEPPEEVDG